jgi:hypothetical protein
MGLGTGPNIFGIYYQCFHTSIRRQLICYYSFEMIETYVLTYCPNLENDGKIFCDAMAIVPSICRYIISAFTRPYAIVLL